MRVLLRYFAVVREVLARSEETLDLPAGARVGDVLDAVCRRDPRLGPMRGLLRAARNLELATDEEALADGDEVALIPPVGGGAPEDGDEAEQPARFRLSAAPVSLDEAVRRVTHAGAGAVVTFVGQVRDEHEGRRVRRLDYEAYPEMVARVLGAIGAAIEAELPGVRLCILHRVGSLAVGEHAVIIAASAPHREEAFAACRAAIERVKREVPIWKREHGEDGATWGGPRS